MEVQFWDPHVHSNKIKQQRHQLSMLTCIYKGMLAENANALFAGYSKMPREVRI